MEVTVRALQAYLKNHYADWAQEQSLFMKLVEEMGEVAEILNQRSGRKASVGTDLKKELGTELADMLHYIVAIAAINDIDLSDAILEKDQQASIKYHRAVNLEAFLSAENRAAEE